MLSRLRIQIAGLLNAIETVFGDNLDVVQNLKRVIEAEVCPDWANAVKSNLIATNAPQKQHDELDSLLEKLSY